MKVTRRLGVASAFWLAAGLAAPAGADAATTTRVSVSSSEVQANGASELLDISVDGRYVLFTSRASNLVPRDTNGKADIFVRDRVAGRTTRVSVSSTGDQANGRSQSGAISADGRIVTFGSVASNLVPADDNDHADIFVHDRRSGKTSRVSVDSKGRGGNNGSFDPDISADGQSIVFASGASNLVRRKDTNDSTDVFLHDRSEGKTVRVSVSSSERQANRRSQSPVVSSGGSFVAFISHATNLIKKADTNKRQDVFLRDRLKGKTVRVSVTWREGEANGNSFDPVISSDGRSVAFLSLATNLTRRSGELQWDVFRRDRTNGNTVRVNVSWNEDQGNSDSFGPAMTPNGRFIAFYSFSTNLTKKHDMNRHLGDVLVRDRGEGTTVRVSVSHTGEQGDGDSFGPAISRNATFVAFSSWASDLVAEPDTNRVLDVFVRGPR